MRIEYHSMSSYKPVIYRTRFAKAIVAEVALPEKQTGKILILAQGFPSVPSKRSVLEFLVGEGYTVIFPRYRGTWESDGYFLEESPTQDIKLVVAELVQQKKFWCSFSRVWIPLRVKNFFVIGSSFGGPAAAWLSQHSLVKKVALLSPVLDWEKEGEAEPFAELIRFTRDGFGMATRLRSTHDWYKLRQNKNFYNFPLSLTSGERQKIFLIHCYDDMVVPIGPARDMIKSGNIQHYYFKPHGGHLGIGHITKLFYWHKIKKFFDAK